MIQLATDPNASRSNWRPAAAEAKDTTSRRPRSAHAWPFISRYTERNPASSETKRPQGSQSGS